MGWLWGSLSYLPYLVASCVLGGIAIAGWLRTRATGALLIAMACGVRVVHELFGVYNMYRMWTMAARREEYLRWAAVSGGFHAAGALVADVLFIVGVALLLRRLPARRAAA
jgi:hypothetical protein